MKIFFRAAMFPSFIATVILLYFHSNGFQLPEKVIVKGSGNPYTLLSIRHNELKQTHAL